MITNFQQLLDAANQQEQPQRLLLLMAKTDTRSKSSKQQTVQLPL